jgi:hypothetical protein
VITRKGAKRRREEEEEKGKERCREKLRASRTATS